MWKMRNVCGNIPQNLKSLAKKDYFFFPIVLLHTFFFDTFLAKNFVDSIIIVTFAVEFERTEKNGRDEDSN